MKEQLGFVIDQNRCIGCRTCQMACKDYKHLDVGMNFRRIYEYETGSWTTDENGGVSQDVNAYYTSISCNHCHHPICKSVCPTGAITKREKDGIVVINPDKCIGCKACMNACPYGAPQFNEAKNKMEKCNLCVERLDQNLKPICVESCPNRALDFGNLQELRAEHGTVAAAAPLITAEVTQPSLVIKPSKGTKPVGDKDGKFVIASEYREFPMDL